MFPLVCTACTVLSTEQPFCVTSTMPPFLNAGVKVCLTVISHLGRSFNHLNEAAGMIRPLQGSFYKEIVNKR